MDKIILLKPTIEYAEDIMKFRQELLNANSEFSGCGYLKNCTSAEEWLKYIEKSEKKETCPVGGVTSNSYIAVRLSDNKIIGIIGINKLTEDILKYLSAREAVNILLSNRNIEKAQDMAAKYNGTAMSLENKVSIIEFSDVLICATSAPSAILVSVRMRFPVYIAV